MKQPSGSVTFLFTDIEGSTRLWEKNPQAMKSAFHRQEMILRSSIAQQSGYAYKMIGDAFQAAFQQASQGLQAAIGAQRRLLAKSWGETEIRVRMALHTGLTEERGDDYVGPELNRIARLLDCGHGGQILMTHVTAGLLQAQLPADCRLEDLGQHHLKDLIQPEQIFQVVVSGLPAKFPPLKTLESMSRNLRNQATVFVGRRQELDEIASLLTDEQTSTRLISLVGPGGVGKTRLALQAAASLLPHFPQGVYFIDLVSCLSQGDMISKIAQALNFSFQVSPGQQTPVLTPKEQLLNYLAWKKILIVFDNFEHLSNQADLISEVLAFTRDLKILVTTRERLNLPEEWVIELSGLSYPSIPDLETLQQYASVQLFVRCAQRVGLSHISEEDWPTIGRICQLVDGLPLGIELAAAWVKLFSLPEIAQKLTHSLDFLEGAQRGHPDRHSSLRAVFEHSWDLLSIEERDSFQRLSIFPGDFSLEAASEISQANLTNISSLIDKSLLKRLSNGRLSIHHILVQYAVEKLHNEPDVRMETESRYGQFYAKVLLLIGEKLFGAEHLAGRDLYPPGETKSAPGLEYYWFLNTASTCCARLPQSSPCHTICLDRNGRGSS